MRLAILFIVLLISNIAGAELISGHPTPLAYELLDNPISLTRKCSEVRITEFRGSEFTENHVAALDFICNFTADHFYNFMKDHNRPVSRIVNPEFDLSLIPVGYNYRDLNDNYFRFDTRPKLCDNNGGRCMPGDTPLLLWGTTDWDNEYIFLRSDLDLDNEAERRLFIEIYMHETFHELSRRSGSFVDIRLDEVLARKFTDIFIRK